MPIATLFGDQKTFDVSTLRERIPLGKVTLSVHSGAHRGTVTTLTTNKLTIGADPANDIVLFADDLAPRHFTVRVTDMFFGKAEVRAIEGPVTLGDGEIVEPGCSVKAQLPLLVRVAETEIEIAPALDLDRFWTRTIGIAVLILGLAIGGQVIASLTKNVFASLSSEPIFTSSTSTDRAQLAGQSGDHLASLRERLASSGLSETISLEQTTTGAIVATGNINDGEAPSWRSVIQWHDAQLRAPLLINNVKKGTQSASLPMVRSVWMGERPYLILESGRRAEEGDTLSDGWSVEKITQANVILNRAGRRVMITF
ncbi:MAG: EscD/YscD/HrpQ family type III secretion system periplasmic domain-containing protein [Pseudomonadota bacterium]